MKAQNLLKNLFLTIGLTVLLNPVYGQETFSDIASNYETSTWVNGSNLGTGFGSWQLLTETSNAGFFVWSSTENGHANINTSNLAFGMWSNTTGSGEAKRAVTSWGNGYTFSIQLAVQWRDGEKGISLYNQDGLNPENKIWNFNITDAGYGTTGWNYYSDMLLSIEVLQNGNNLQIEVEGSSVGQQWENIFSTTIENQTLGGFGVYKKFGDADGQGQRNLYFNNLLVTSSITPATVEPNVIDYFINWDNANPELLITWNDASEVTGLSLYEEDIDEWILLPVEMWEVINDNGTTATLYIDLEKLPSKAGNSKEYDQLLDMQSWRVEFNVGPPAVGTTNVMAKIFTIAILPYDENENLINFANVTLEPNDEFGNPGIVTQNSYPQNYNVYARGDYKYTISANGFATKQGTIENIEEDIPLHITLESVPVYEFSYTVSEGYGNISASANGNYIFSGSLVNEGSNIEVIASPQWNYRIKEWTINGLAVEDFTNEKLIIENIQQATYVTVKFELIPIISTFPWLEDFESELGEWAVHDIDDDGQAWELTTLQNHSPLGSKSIMHNGTPKGTKAEQVGWLVSQQIELPWTWPGMVLKFWSYNQNAENYGQNTVSISMGSPNPEDGDFIPRWSAESVTEEWVETKIVLGQLTYNRIYIGFKYENNGASPHTWFIDDVSISNYEEPSIEPEYQIFGLDDNTDIDFTINWGSESTVKGISLNWFDDQDEFHEIELIDEQDYSISGNTLTISWEFMVSINPIPYEWYNFQITYGSDFTNWFGIVVIETTKPTISPTQLSYDLSNKHDLFTTIKWGLADEITSISTIEKGELIKDQHYTVVGGWLYIKDLFLTNTLAAVTDEVDLLITFNTNDQATLNINTIESGVLDASIDPSQITFYDHQFPDYIDINITFNDATEVVGDLHVLVVSKWNVEELMYPYFEVFDNEDGTAVLKIDFTEVNKSRALQSKEPYSTEYTYVTVTINFDVGSPAPFLMTILNVKYKVNTSSNPQEGGWVTGGGVYRPNDLVTLEAHPNSGFIFWNWEDENEQIVSSNNPYSFNMPEENIHVRAKFMAVQYFPVTFIVVGGNGSITGEANGEPIESGDEIILGSELDFTAHPDEGYRVKSWTANDYTIPNYVNNTYKLGTHNSPFDLKVEFESGMYYSITFHVTDAMGNISNATVTVGGYMHYTNSEGIFIYSNIEAGDYPYTVSKTDYVDVSGVVTVIDADVTEHVVLTALNVENITLDKIRAFPNPFGNFIEISYPDIVKRVIVTNIIGQTLMDFELNGRKEFNTTNLKKGVYLITFEGNNGDKIVRRMVKQ